MVIPNAELFTHSVTVNTAFGIRRWEYEFSVNADPGSGVIKLRLTWWTQSPRQHEMIASHDRVLTAVRESLRQRVVDQARESKARPA